MLSLSFSGNNVLWFITWKNSIFVWISCLGSERHGIMPSVYTHMYVSGRCLPILQQPLNTVTKFNRGVEASELIRCYHFYQIRCSGKRHPVNGLVEMKSAAGTELLLDNSETIWEKDLKNTQLQAKLLIFLRMCSNQHWEPWGSRFHLLLCSWS